MSAWRRYLLSFLLFVLASVVIVNVRIFVAKSVADQIPAAARNWFVRYSIWGAILPIVAAILLIPWVGRKLDALTLRTLDTLRWLGLIRWLRRRKRALSASIYFPWWRFSLDAGHTNASKAIKALNDARSFVSTAHGQMIAHEILFDIDEMASPHLRASRSIRDKYMQLRIQVISTRFTNGYGVGDARLVETLQRLLNSKYPDNRKSATTELATLCELSSRFQSDPEADKFWRNQYLDLLEGFLKGAFETNDRYRIHNLSGAIAYARSDRPRLYRLLGLVMGNVLVEDGGGYLWHADYRNEFGNVLCYLLNETLYALASQEDQEILHMLQKCEDFCVFREVNCALGFHSKLALLAEYDEKSSQTGRAEARVWQRVTPGAAQIMASFQIGGNAEGPYSVLDMSFGGMKLGGCTGVMGTELENITIQVAGTGLQKGIGISSAQIVRTDNSAGRHETSIQFINWGTGDEELKDLVLNHGN